MLSQTYFFPCPNCSEIISSDADKCKYCNHPVDPVAAQDAIKLQEQINQACNDASTLRNLAGFMWVAFAIQFIYALMGRLFFFGLMIAVPAMLINWQLKFGRIRTNDVDFKSAKRNRNIALGLWMPIPILLIVLIVILAAGRSNLSYSLKENRSSTTDVSTESQTSTWKVINPDDSSYSIEFPKSPERKSFEHTERGYTIYVDQLSLSSNMNNYFVASSNIPYKATLEERVESALSRIKNSTHDIKEISHSRISQDGCLGIEWYGTSSNYPTIVLRVIETQPRLYMLGILSERNEPEVRPDIQHFLNSFKLSDKMKCQK